jgi:hypothetical protein
VIIVLILMLAVEGTVKNTRVPKGSILRNPAPLIPNFAGSNPTEAVGFLKGDKNPQHAFLRKRCKMIGPMSQICGMVKNPGYISQASFGRHFSPIGPPLAARGLPRVVDAGGIWRPEQERLEK